MNLSDAQNLLIAVSEEVEAASFGLSNWSNVAQRISDGFSGSSCAILSEDQAQQVLRHFDFVNVEKRHMDAYAEYFAFRNPWMKVWARVPDGGCAVSERDFPAKLLQNTEFYADFVRKIPDFDASTAISIDIDPANTFRIPLHYSVAYAERYDPWAEWLMTRLKGVLQRTAHSFAALQERAEREIGQAALTNRGDVVAIVLDRTMRIVDASPKATAAFRDRSLLIERFGKLDFCQLKLAETVTAAVKSLTSSAASPVSSIVWNGETGRWLISFSAIASSRINPFVSPRPLVLLQLRNVTLSFPAEPLADFAQMFRLTAAEELFCRHLAAGQSVREIATATNVTFETARSRLKSIFQKTAVHRQGELVALLHGFLNG